MIGLTPPAHLHPIPRPIKPTQVNLLSQAITVLAQSPVNDRAHTSISLLPVTVRPFAHPWTHVDVRISGPSAATGPPNSSTRLPKDHFPPLLRQRPKGVPRPGPTGSPSVTTLIGQPPVVLLNPAAASRPHKSFLDAATDTSTSTPKLAPNPTTFHKGAPAIHFTIEEIEKLA